MGNASGWAFTVPVFGQHFEQESVEGLVGTVELVDQQHGRTVLR